MNTASKKEYRKPMMDITQFPEEDAIRTSGNVSYDWSTTDNELPPVEIIWAD